MYIRYCFCTCWKYEKVFILCESYLTSGKECFIYRELFIEISIFVYMDSIYLFGSNFNQCSIKWTFTIQLNPFTSTWTTIIWEIKITRKMTLDSLYVFYIYYMYKAICPVASLYKELYCNLLSRNFSAILLYFLLHENH